LFRDTFVGTYAVEYVKQKQHGKWDIRAAVERACKASARTIEQLGAQESIPWADEVDPHRVEQHHEANAADEQDQPAQPQLEGIEYEIEV
jgi:hypothetical protein